MNASQQSALKQIQRVITATLPHDRQMNSEKKLREEQLRVKPTCMPSPPPNLNLRQTAALTSLGVISFHLAYNFPGCSFLIAVYLACLASLAWQRTNRRAFYFGLITGLFAYAPQLSCFYTIFGTAAVALWLVLAFWIGLFGLVARLCLVRFGPRWAIAFIPVVWTGLEYFRSECYYLRFTWLNAGYAFSDHVQTLPFGFFGVYGFGFLLMLFATGLTSLAMASLPWRLRLTRPAALVSGGGVLALTALGSWTNLKPTVPIPLHTNGLTVAGVQMEFPGDPQVVTDLNKLKKQHPEASLLVLSEYTFTESLPDIVKKWCRNNQRYLIVGGKDFVDEKKFFDTAFVIDPQGEIVFRQAKSVPIQFFNDGLPAREQKLWNSPWGKIGICICYDLSYTQVADRLVRLGAQALIVPTMDVVDWGRHEHELHARIAPLRAAEYGVPIFRVASSGISQLVDARGTVTATAPFPGEDASVSGWLELGRPGQVPFDRVLAKAAVWLTASLLGWLALYPTIRQRFRQRIR